MFWFYIITVIIACLGACLKSSRGSVVNVTDLHPVSLGSTPAAVHLSHWWRQEEHLTKVAPVRQ